MPGLGFLETNHQHSQRRPCGVGERRSDGWKLVGVEPAQRRALPATDAKQGLKTWQLVSTEMSRMMRP